MLSRRSISFIFVLISAISAATGFAQAPVIRAASGQLVEIKSTLR